MSPATIEFSAINTAALGFLHTLLPGGNVVGREYVVKNPTRPDNKAGSFKINCDSGKWTDFATGDSGGDLIDLWKYVRGYSDLGVAARELAQMVGVPVHCSGGHQKRKPAAAPVDDWVPITPIPPNAPPLHAEKFCPLGFKIRRRGNFVIAPISCTNALPGLIDRQIECPARKRSARLNILPRTGRQLSMEAKGPAEK